MTATLAGDAVVFSVRSPRADTVWLCLFDDDDGERRIAMARDGVPADGLQADGARTGRMPAYSGSTSPSPPPADRMPDRMPDGVHAPPATSAAAASLWLWRAHNAVNLRLNQTAKEEQILTLGLRKMIYPDAITCPTCRTPSWVAPL